LLASHEFTRLHLEKADMRVLLSIILMGSVLYPQIGREMIIAILAAGSVSALGIYFVTSSGPPLCRPTGRCAIRGECPRLAGCRRDL
jgi:hypothetical protein